MRVLAYALLAIAAAALVGWTGFADRWLHPARQAVTGSALVSLDRYADAAGRVLRPGSQIARLTLPDGNGPVAIDALPAATVYLDPPTARVLEVAVVDDPVATRLPAPPALPLSEVVARAAPLAKGAPLHRIDWPGIGAPDWTLRFVAGGDAVTVKIADDVGTALLARNAGSPAIVQGRMPWLIVAGTAGATAIAMLTVIGRRTSRRKRRPR